jgi:hypothetical protein
MLNRTANFLDRIGDIDAARALPPREPSSAAAAFAESGSFSVSSPARRLRPVVGPPATPAAIGSFRINPLNR